MPTHYHISTLIIAAMWFSWMAYWAFRARGTKRNVYVQPGREQWAFRICLVAAIVCMQDIPFLHTRFLPPYLALEIVGIALCAAGLAFAVWARLYLGGNWSARVTVKENHELVTTGPYARVRHPIYTGVLTAIFGTTLALTPSIGGCITLTLAIIAFSLKLRQEEALMLKEFPEAYPAYKARVRAAVVPWFL